ncbi:MAG: pantetheine-phosphate adenylyltransferase [Candidatus Levybacteria bacterium]|nr:pantetheine-phosphate adenylyltransferase [Candidatus Levybacteria bacterium]
MTDNLVVCGGTFDHLHKGHETFLRLACSVGKEVIIGLTSDKFVRRWKVEDRSLKQFEEFEKRKRAVLEFVKAEGVLDKVEIVEINDLFGPTLDRILKIDTIVVSEDSKKGAEIINQKREELGLSKLDIIIAPQVLSEDGKIISSQRIRAGQISREGKLYVSPLWFGKDLILPENLRKEFQKPFGEIIRDGKKLSVDRNNLVITVGDVTTGNFNENFIKQNVSVVDFKIAREAKFTSFSELGFSGDEEIITANNPAGHITSDLFSKVINIFKSDFGQRIILKIKGEEDLAVLPLILAAPLAAVIYYGQPNVGLVRIEVSEGIKKIAHGLVDGFEI